MTDLGYDAIFMISFMFLGAWLEGINGKHGFFDELLTPIPMGFCGMLVVLERALV